MIPKWSKVKCYEVLEVFDVFNKTVGVNMQMRSMYSIGEGAIESGVELLLLEFEAEKGKIVMHGPGLQV